jgi:hypothetical protein
VWDIITRNHFYLFVRFFQRQRSYCASVMDVNVERKVAGELVMQSLVFYC